jgi:threonyl-tRNA synthetase
LKDAGYRVEMDLDNAKIGAKIAKAEMQKVPYMLVIGDREAENNSVSLRGHGRRDLGASTKEELLARLKEESEYSG